MLRQLDSDSPIPTPEALEAHAALRDNLGRLQETAEPLKTLAARLKALGLPPCPEKDCAGHWLVALTADEMTAIVKVAAMLPTDTVPGR